MFWRLQHGFARPWTGGPGRLLPFLKPELTFSVSGQGHRRGQRKEEEATSEPSVHHIQGSPVLCTATGQDLGPWAGSLLC